MEQNQPQGGGCAKEAREGGQGLGKLKVQPTEAVIFDLDGTLINSEPVYKEADEIFLARRGVTVPEHEWADYVGLGGNAIIELMKSRYRLEGSVEDLIAEKDQSYLALTANDSRVFPAMRELVLALLLHDVPLSIATSSRRNVLDAVIESAGLARAFRTTVASDDVARHKPDPESYLLAAQRLGVDPERCWVIEDSQYGVEAARRAGMRVIAVPAAGHEALPAFSAADLLVPGGSAVADPQEILQVMGLDRVAAGAARFPSISEFRDTVYDFYRRGRRDMPWRNTTDPYEILVSELMLQQTQSDRVVPKYRAFLQAFPTVEALASAPLQDVLQRWQGLGYNRRAKYLHDAARVVVERHGGAVPDTEAGLRSLPGVGPYTAGAVLAFAWGVPAVFVETNIRRAILHVFFPGQEAVSDRKVVPIVSATVDTTDPRNWYYALMDYGAYLGSAFANANKRSAHYQVQSRFSGSIREVRGAIVRELTASGCLDQNELEQRVAREDPRFAPALEGLGRDGLVVIRDGTVCLP